jgi:SAM-dependent methyltransferase
MDRSLLLDGGKLDSERHSVNLNTSVLECTGERMIPGESDAATFWEHVARYRFACQYVAGRDVVDIACGEGYGTAALQRAGARTTIGIDVAEEAVSHAKKKYGIDARCGSAEAIPLPDNSVDLVVSFETIEHVPEPLSFLNECARILRLDGMLIMSTPNVNIYHDRVSKNPFHCSEMKFDEFSSLVKKRFMEVRAYGQTRPRPWYLRLRGFRRCSYMLRNLVDARPTIPANFGSSDMAKLCSRRPGMLERMLCPDSVKSCTKYQLQRSMYVTVVARGKRA